jgi:double-stranded uracil-DNA glycosylase
MTMAVLPDYLAPGLKVVFCGTAVGEQSAARGHYFAGRGNDFWRLLDQTGLTPHLLAPEDDSTLPSYSIGLTDLAKNVAQSHDRGLVYDVEGFTRKLAAYKPTWVAFTSKEAGKAAAKALGQAAARLGVESWRIASSRVFVLPSPSAANRGGAYDGRSTREWWQELAILASRESA